MTQPDGTPETGDRDWRLVEALRRREATAAERLVATFGDRAYRLAIGITGNQQDAEEAVQDSFWNVVRRIDTFRGQSSLRSWIYRITANAAYQKRRSGTHRRNEIALDEVLPRCGMNCVGRNSHCVFDVLLKLAWERSDDVDAFERTQLGKLLNSDIRFVPRQDVADEATGGRELGLRSDLRCDAEIVPHLR